MSVKGPGKQLARVDHAAQEIQLQLGALWFWEGKSLDLSKLPCTIARRSEACVYAVFFGIQENTTTIVFRMFDKVLAPELIPSVLEKFIRVYMREHDLQEEELLLLYIEVTLLRLVCFLASMWCMITLNFSRVYY